MITKRKNNMKSDFKRTKYACYYTNLSMASVFCLPPILFMTFREMYGLSYTLLGSLVAVNFITQLGIDLVFSFFGKYLNPHIALRITPLLTGIGLTVYSLVPMLFPQYAYVGLLIGTVIFSLAAGLAEVLVSPTVDALPSDTHDKDMAALHSLYGYGLVLVIALSTVYLQIFGTQNWMYLALFWAVPPIIASVLLFKSDLPDMNASHGTGNVHPEKRTAGLILCMLCIFFGSCAENSMTNWISSYLETVLHIPKAVGDIFGLMLFAILLSLTRTWYAKKGKNIYRVLMISMVGSVFCYITAGLSTIPVISMLACILTGIFTSMLWPGTLIYMDEKIPYAGVTAYALMAAGGDFGASIAPEMLGVITDTVAASEWGVSFSQSLSISPDQLGMKIGMLVASVFPIFGVAVLLYMKKYFKKLEK